jgi:hypothetical protein
MLTYHRAPLQCPETGVNCIVLFDGEALPMFAFYVEPKNSETLAEDCGWFEIVEPLESESDETTRLLVHQLATADEGALWAYFNPPIDSSVQKVDVFGFTVVPAPESSKQWAMVI